MLTTAWLTGTVSGSGPSPDCDHFFLEVNHEAVVVHRHSILVMATIGNHSLPYMVTGQKHVFQDLNRTTNMIS